MRLVAGAAALLAGCLPAAAPVSAPASAPAFRPEVFFDGPTHGDPVLSVRTKGAQRLRVESIGTAQPDGSFRLDQHIAFPDGRTADRTWTMTPLGGGRYAATLTPDALGPVDIRTEGNRMHIRYRMGRMTTMAQTLTLRPGGQVADNEATVRIAGIPVARLVEVIARGRRTPQAASRPVQTVPATPSPGEAFPFVPSGTPDPRRVEQEDRVRR